MLNCKPVKVMVYKGTHAHLCLRQDGYSEDGALIGRTQWDAPDIDPIVFLSEEDSNTSGLAPLEVGQLRRCRVIGNSIFGAFSCAHLNQGL
eukprot:scaffold215603_cov17-Tisochrysis_lutea.AAC.1